MTPTEYGTCKDCRWWGRELNGVCDRVGYAVDNRHNPDVTHGADRFYMAVYADDDQGLGADLHTGPDFGCVHFERKWEGK